MRQLKIQDLVRLMTKKFCHWALLLLGVFYLPVCTANNQTTTLPVEVLTKESFIQEALEFKRTRAKDLLAKLEKSLAMKADFDPDEYQFRNFHLRISSKEKISLDFIEAQITGRKVETNPLRGRLGLADAMHWWSFAWPLRITDARPLLDLEITFRRHPNLPPLGAGLKIEKVRREFILSQPTDAKPVFLDVHIAKQDPFSLKYDLELQQLDLAEESPSEK
jgi:hypothetical protein